MYRCYLLSAGQHIDHAIDLRCDSDADAIAEAKAALQASHASGAELWQASRIVWRQIGRRR